MSALQDDSALVRGLSMPAKPHHLPQPARQAPQTDAPTIAPFTHHQPGQVFAINVDIAGGRAGHLAHVGISTLIAHKHMVPLRVVERIRIAHPAGREFG